MNARGEGIFLWGNSFFAPAYTNREVRSVKEDEKKPIPWEAADPKPPVIRSGHMENRIRN